jgi:hypothetical protein
MVEKILVDREIAAGQLLLKELGRRGIAITAAFWFYKPEFERWRLVIAMPLCDKEGPIVAYDLIQKALGKLPKTRRLALGDISAENTKNTIVQALCKMVQISPGKGTLRISRSSVNGVFIDDAVVYRTSTALKVKSESGTKPKSHKK